MSIIKDHLHKRVSQCLTKFDVLRDDDKRLVINVWISELEDKGIIYTEISALSFFTLFRDGVVSNPDTITRLRRKMQEDNPHLRGAKYNERQKRVADYQTELGYATTRE